MDLADAQQPRWCESEQAVDAPSSDNEPEESAAQRKQDAFNQQLPHDWQAPRAERGANGDLVSPRRGTREQQVSHVEAGDCQEHGNGSVEDDEGALDLAGQLLPQRHEGDAAVLVEIVPGRERARDRLHLAVG